MSSSNNDNKDVDEFTFPTLPSSTTQVKEIHAPSSKFTVTHVSNTNSTVQPAKIVKSNELENRIKVALKPGYSQIAWMNKCNKDPNLGKSGITLKKEWTFREVRKHNSIDDGWMIIRNKVYNIVPYLNYHPGGIDILKPVLGKDGTALFHKYHSWVNVDAMLESCFLGYLQKK